VTGNERTNIVTQESHTFANRISFKQVISVYHYDSYLFCSTRSGVHRCDGSKCIRWISPYSLLFHASRLSDHFCHL